MPRLSAADVDVKLVRIVNDTDPNKSDWWFSLKDDLKKLDTYIQRFEGKLLIIDPIAAYLGNKDSHKDAEIRGILGPLSKLAERTGVTILCIMHVNKNESMKGAHRANGSVAFTNAARSVLMFTKHPDDEKIVVVEQVKQNLGPSSHIFGYNFHLHESVDLTNPKGPPISVAKIGYIALTDEQIVAYRTAQNSRQKNSETQSVGRPTKEREAAIAFLKEFLADGSRTTSEIQAAAEEDGIKWRTVDRAKKALRITTTHINGPEHRWSLPTPTTTTITQSSSSEKPSEKPSEPSPEPSRILSIEEFQAQISKLDAQNS